MAEAKIIDGKGFATNLRASIARRVARLKAEHGITPGLAVVLVGEDPASQIYVRNKHKQTEAAGMLSVEKRLPATASQEELLALVDELNNDPAINGILVQLPLPDHMDETAVIAAIDPAKDVDGFHVINSGLLMTGPGRHGTLHATGLPDAAGRHPGRHDRAGRGRDRAVEHRRQTDGAAFAAKELHGDHGPFAHPRPAGRHAPR